MLEIIGYVAIMWVLTNYISIVLDKLKLNKLQKYVCLKCYTFFFVLFLHVKSFYRRHIKFASIFN